MNRHTLQLWFVLAFVLFPPLGNADAIQFDHIEVELVSEVNSIQPDRPFWVALRLKPDKDWHFYWRNPGDAGLPTRIDWQLPEGSDASAISWPVPERFIFQDMVSYGYGEETLLLTEIQPPPDWDKTRPFPVAAEASWLVCEDTCIPGRADLLLELPVSESGPNFDTRWRAAFEGTREQVPVPKNDWQSAFTMHEGQLYLRVKANSSAFEDAEQIIFLPYENEIIKDEAPQQVERQPSQVDLRQQQSQFFTNAPNQLGGVILVDRAGSESAYAITASPTLVAQPAVFDQAQAPAAAPKASTSLLFVMLSAVIGGVLLNLMPCVFPVLSLKAISLLESVHISHNAQRLHGIAYTAGAMVFFAAVAGVLYLLQASGASVGWGFQLQSPWFVGILAYLLFVMGLSFSGLIEVGSSLMGVGNELTNRSGYSGSFFTGALAAVVASPCTAPFMGTAIAFAIAQPPLISLAVFLALGFGMAFPFLLISFMPVLVRILPKPGNWMVVLRQFMAFPLYITVIWLLWVLGRQTSASGMAAALGGMLLLVFAIWLLKLRAHTVGHWRRFAEALMIVATFSAFAILHMPFLNEPALKLASDTTERKADWERYSADRLRQLRTEGVPIFINMTADWCISCIANERVALSFPSVRQAFLDKNVALLKGDWTSRNPEITDVLHQFGREGVPLYVLYPPYPEAEPLVLPQFLTPNIVLNALEKISPADGQGKKGDKIARMNDPSVSFRPLP